MVSSITPLYPMELERNCPIHFQPNVVDNLEDVKNTSNPSSSVSNTNNGTSNYHFILVTCKKFRETNFSPIINMKHQFSFLKFQT